MRILVVGAGAVGGYFGGRLAQAGRDVTFLVRRRRAGLLRANGLVILSPLGDYVAPSPQIVTTESLDAPFDLVILSCKAYDLDDAMDSFAAAVGPRTAILPLLNGMAHVDALSARFGADKVLGGLCMISSTLDESGAILHLNRIHGMIFGEWQGGRTPRLAAVAEALLDAGFDARESAAIRQDMWDKWIFIAGLAGATCLMRASVGDIVAAGATDLATALFDECAAIAGANGFPPGADHVNRTRAFLSEPGSTMTASMLRDIESGARIESQHIFGDLLRRADGDSPLLRAAFAHARSYEARRAREQAAAERAAATA
jgi:2-dehydropantoate 2-reductase